MTRFARAKGAAASNERVEEEATPWHQMVKQIRTATGYQGKGDNRDVEDLDGGTALHSDDEDGPDSFTRQKKELQATHYEENNSSDENEEYDIKEGKIVLTKLCLLWH